ncbi:hypothetical protein F5882DRAFT_390452 [Hyaloscypha sp. PMI_1271]|nr:hypothetical protein F5882DRAFT_390452 [Hyaloscypha sp. PMI_1271]
MLPCRPNTQALLFLAFLVQSLFFQALLLSLLCLPSLQQVILAVPDDRKQPVPFQHPILFATFPFQAPGFGACCLLGFQACSLVVRRDMPSRTRCHDGGVVLYSGR